jgi:cytoskeletal protein CcmA (bactofilin family)
MFTKKPESGDSVTKMGSERSGELKTPFTERPATYSSKSPSPAASKMVPSIIGEDLSITGNVTSKGEIQVDGEIQGDINCGSLLLGDKSQVMGGVVAEDVVVRGRVVGSIRGLRVTLQAQSHVEGDIFHQSLAIEQGAYFEGKSRRSDNPLAEAKAAGGGAPRVEAPRPDKAANSDSKPKDEPSVIPTRAAE